ncbi:WD repeat-containing protein 43 [Borealophlyctis nickersoniae]|nr:WD repeat-containing protein 43 [Borealophlyctis nickersoniae]
MGKRKSAGANAASGPFSATAVKQTQLQQEHSLGASEPFLLSAFDPANAAYFAAVSQAVDSYRLRIWDTKTSSLVGEYAAPAGNACSCLAWGEEGGDNGQSSSRKKKRRTEGGSKLIALGLSNGTITLYSLARGQIVRTLEGGHSAAVADVCFDKSGRRAFSGGEDGVVVEWDVKSGVELSKFKADGKAVRKVVLSDDGSQILTANNQIKLWDAQTKALVKNYPGHATAVTNLAFSSTSPIFLSSASQDRFLSVWDTSAEGPTTNTSALTLDSPATHHISISRADHVLALSQDGAVYFWQSVQGEKSGEKDGKKRKQVARMADGKLRILQEGAEGKVSPVLAASFVGGLVLIARGHVVKPAFERVAYLDGSNKILETVDLTRAPTSSLIVDDASLAEQSIRASTKAYKESDSVTVGHSDLPSVPVDLSEPTLEDRLTSISLATPSHPAKALQTNTNGALPTGANLKRPTAATLHTLLAQAIHTADAQLIEQALRITDHSVIMQTVRRMSPAHVVPFLEMILERMQKTPGRTSGLVEWMRAVLVVHAAYLMSVPQLVSQLGTLYQALDSRVTTFPKLLRLSGRLDLVMTQISLRKSEEAQQEAEADGVVVYDEEEEEEEGGSGDVSDEDMMDFVGEVDEEDDEEGGRSSDDDDDDDDEEEDGEDESDNDAEEDADEDADV